MLVEFLSNSKWISVYNVRMQRCIYIHTYVFEILKFIANIMYGIEWDDVRNRKRTVYKCACTYVKGVASITSNIHIFYVK